MTFKSVFITSIFLLLPSLVHAIMPGQIRFNNESADTTLITRILVDEYAQSPTTTGERIVRLAKQFEGKPYVSGTLEGTPEMLTVNLDGFDCTTLVETVLALAITLEERRTSWIDFARNLEQLRYRRGTIDGYGSRLHYFSDWVVDNTHSGLITEVTDRIGPATYQIRTLDFMSSNRDKYPAMADDAAFQQIKAAEVGYRSHRFPFIKPQSLKNTALREGDIVAFVAPMKTLDVTHMGIITIKGGQPYLIHASSKGGKVMVEPKPLAVYLRRNHSIPGIRIIRLKN